MHFPPMRIQSRRIDRDLAIARAWRERRPFVEPRASRASAFAPHRARASSRPATRPRAPAVRSLEPRLARTSAARIRTPPRPARAFVHPEANKMAATTCATLHFNALRATPARASRPAARCVPRTPRRADPEPPRGRERRVSRSETRRARPPPPREIRSRGPGSASPRSEMMPRRARSLLTPFDRAFPVPPQARLPPLRGGVQGHPGRRPRQDVQLQGGVRGGVRRGGRQPGAHRASPPARDVTHQTFEGGRVRPVGIEAFFLPPTGSRARLTNSIAGEERFDR
jgi:hypothetical protein